jgi:hypothetical protein
MSFNGSFCLYFDLSLSTVVLRSHRIEYSIPLSKLSIYVKIGSESIKLSAPIYSFLENFVSLEFISPLDIAVLTFGILVA